MSDPLACMRYDPPENVVEPGIAGAPTSTACWPAGRLVRVIATCEKAAVAVAFGFWLLTASPTYAVVPSETVTCPICTHAAPSVDEYDVRVVPVLTTRNQTGAVALAPQVVDVVAAVCGRRTNDVPPAGSY